MSPPTLRHLAAPDKAGEPIDADPVDRFVRRPGAMLPGKLPWMAGLFLLGLLALDPPGQANDAPGQETGAAKDRFGDPLPVGAVARLGTVRLRHGADVLSVSFSPDGKLLATAGWPGQGDLNALRLWDAATGKERFLLTDPELDAFLAVFAPAGNLLAAVRREAVLLVDVTTGKEVRRLVTPGDSWARALAFSADGKRLAAAGADKVLRLYDVATGKELRQFRGHTAEVNSVALSADGKTLASGGTSGDATARLWDADTGNPLRPLHSPNRGGLVSAVAFTPDGKSLLVAGDGEPTLFAVATGKEIRQYKGHRNAVPAAAFSPDGKYLATAGGDSRIRVFDAATGEQLHALNWAQDSALCLAISEDSSTLAVGGRGNTARLWDLKTGKERDAGRGHWGGIGFLAFTPDGRSVLTAGWDGTVRVWDPGTSRERRRFGEKTGEVAYWARQGEIAGLAPTPDGLGVVLGSWGDTMTVLDLATGKQRRPFGDKQAAVMPVEVSPDGKRLLTMSQSGPPTLWDLAAGKELCQFKGHEGQVTTAKFAPDGKTVTTASRDVVFISGLANGPRGIKDSTLRFWDVATGKERHRVEAAVVAMAYSPDGKTLATGTGMGEVQWRDAATGKVWRAVKVHPSWVNSLAFSPDGRCLASAGLREGTVYLWENASGLERGRFAGHRGDVNRVAFSPDGRTLASGGVDTSVLLWDVTGLRPGARSRERPMTDPTALWIDLGSTDGRRSSRAVWSLVAAPRVAVPLLEQRLRPVRPAADEQVRKWIADLESERFAVRNRATEELEKLRELAEPALRAAKAEGGLEIRRRVELLLKQIEDDRLTPGATRLRELRGVEVLEHMGTPEARRVLEEIARGAGRARLTAEARAALGRLKVSPGGASQ
jgi:WD40 repeat protein